MSNKISPVMEQMLQNKVDKIYMRKELDQKASKNEVEIAIKKLEVLQK